MRNSLINLQFINFGKKTLRQGKIAQVLNKSVANSMPILLKGTLTADIFCQKPIWDNSECATLDKKLKFCENIIQSHKNISFPEGSKFKIVGQITDPFELLQNLEASKTPYDTEEIIIQRAQKLVAGELEIQGNKKMYGLKNHPLIGEILSDATAQIDKAKKEKKLYIVTGNSASGKSTFCKKNGLTAQNGYFLIDSDEIKKMLPFYDEFGNNFTHNISSLIACAELSLAIEQGSNIVFPTTGTGKIAVEVATKHGYEIEFIHCASTIDECIERSMQRFRTEKRFIDPNYIIENEGVLDRIKELTKKYNININIV